MLIPQVFQLVTQHNTAGQRMITDHTDLAMALVRMVTHPSIIWAHGCLTSVVNHEMLAPSY